MEDFESNEIYTTNYLRNNINFGKKKQSTTDLGLGLIQPQNQSQQYVMSRGLSSGSQTKIEKNIKSSSETQIETKKNIRITRINVDSRHRNLESKNILDSQIYYLGSNPISIIPQNDTNSISDIVITHPGHSFQVNDNIVIQGVEAKRVVLENSITFIANSSYARINHKAHGINFDSINSIYVEITNFIGNINGGTEYNNIPINEINGFQKIYPTMNLTEIKNNDYYYINMGSIISNFSETYSLTSLTITFKDLNGVNLNLINANFPVNIFELAGFQTISAITSSTYRIRLNINNNITISNVGGNKIWVARVNDFIEGYKDNNFYKLSLKKTFYDVIKIKLISTEFPNTEKVVKSIPQSKKNNAFYWKLQSDGNTIYSVELEPGNYSISLLQTSLQYAIQGIKRPNLTIINENTSEYSYYEYNICSVTIEPRTDTFSIEFFSTIFVAKAITFKSGINYVDQTGRLILNHPNHRLIEGKTITIINATATDSIPQEVINNTFSIEKIIDENTYQVKLPKYNIASSNIAITNGGDAMGITFPVKAQLLFDQLDTIGGLIGYRNVGKPYSITNFSFINKNTDLYRYDDIDNSSVYTNNSINLSGDNYILMCSPLFKNSYNTGLVDNVFAKLLLAGDPGTILYNQYIQLGETFETPIPSFSQWEVSFYDAMGVLYNFGNLEHSYTLEIYELITGLN
jgi:hypothetical protein